MKTQDRTLARLDVPIIGIFIILLLQGLVWASDFLIPVTASFLGYFVLNKPRRWLQTIGINPVMSASLFTAILAGRGNSVVALCHTLTILDITLLTGSSKGRKA